MHTKIAELLSVRMGSLGMRPSEAFQDVGRATALIGKGGLAGKPKVFQKSKLRHQRAVGNWFPLICLGQNCADTNLASAKVQENAVKVLGAWLHAQPIATFALTAFSGCQS